MAQTTLDPASGVSSPTPPPPKPPPHLWLGLHVHPWAAVGAGLIAGTLFLFLEVTTAYIFGTGTPFGPAHVTLHGLIGSEELPQHLNPGLVLAGLFLHVSLSVLLAFPLALLIHPWRRSALVPVIGLLMGVVLYFLNFNLFAFAMPLMATVRDVSMLVHYAIFGLVTAWVYKRLSLRKSRSPLSSRS